MTPNKSSQERKLCILTGGVRSGKSARAEKLARQWGGDGVSFLATAQALDQEMSERISKHRLQRPSIWETIEEPLNVANAFAQTSHPVVVLDCVTLWVTNLLLGPGPQSIEPAVNALLQAWTNSDKSLIVVTNEVGWGIVPADPVSRQFRDLLGWANQQLVNASTEAWLMASGRGILLSPERV